METLEDMKKKIWKIYNPTQSHPQVLFQNI